MATDDLKRRMEKFHQKCIAELREGGDEFAGALQSEILRGEGMETDLVISALQDLTVTQLVELIQMLTSTSGPSGPDRILAALRRTARAELSFRNGEKPRPTVFELPSPLTLHELLASGHGAVAAAETLNDPAGRMLFVAVARVCEQMVQALRSEPVGGAVN